MMCPAAAPATDAFGPCTFPNSPHGVHDDGSPGVMRIAGEPLQLMCLHAAAPLECEGVPWGIASEGVGELTQDAPWTC